MGTTTESIFRIERRERIGIIWFDVPDRSQNVLREGFDDDLRAAIGELTETASVEAVVIASGKAGSFCAGADVHMLDEATSATEVTALSRRAQAAMDQIRTLDVPVVAAIAGSCLGGGLELALACDRRIAADDDATEFGFPEVQLGLLPGAGGTQYLHRTIGVRAALDLMLKGDTRSPVEAERIGLVDDVVHPAILLDTAVEAATRLASQDHRKEQRSWRDRIEGVALENSSAAREVVFRTARSQVEARTGDRMPAPHRILDTVRCGLDEGLESGLAAEAEAFGELAMTNESRNLRGVFLDRQALNREADERIGEHEISVSRIGVIGGGLMGSGIAEVSLTKAQHSVRLRDIDLDATRAALASVHDVFEARGVPERDRAVRSARLTVTTGTEGFGDVDAAIEAVLEDVEVKRSVYEEIEPLLADPAILATNTSSIPLAELSKHVERADRFVGMHYFSPVGRVPLLEVVRGAETGERAVAVATAIGRDQGKTVVVVNDGPGFYTSRILARYLDEAARMADAGTDPLEIDAALESIGFPVGPFELLDSVGIDVGVEIADVLHRMLGDRFEPAPLLERLAADGRKGRKNGKGIYRYEMVDGEAERHDELDESVRSLLGQSDGSDRKQLERDVVVERCLLAMVVEAVHCLDNGILSSARDGDAAAVLGLGFPPQLGGPFRYIDDRGRPDVIEACRRFGETGGPRWAVPAGLSGTPGTFRNGDEEIEHGT